MLAVVTGARRAEILGITWDRVDLERGRIRIAETMQRLADGTLGFAPPKTAASERDVPLSPAVIERLRRLRAEQAERRLAVGAGWNALDLVCEKGDGSPLDPMSFTHGFARIAQRAGMDGIRLHDCRHGVITALRKQGVPVEVVSAIAGHTSVSFTAQTYVHVDDEQIERAAIALAAAFGALD
jgi:integrase